MYKRQVEIDGVEHESYTSPHNAVERHCLDDTELKRVNRNKVVNAFSQREADMEKLMPLLRSGMTLTQAAHHLAGGD